MKPQKIEDLLLIEYFRQSARLLASGAHMYTYNYIFIYLMIILHLYKYIYIKIF